MEFPVACESGLPLHSATHVSPHNVLYYFEVDYDDDMYGTAFLYAATQEEAVGLISRLMFYNPLHDKITTSYPVTDLTVLTQEQLDRALVCSMRMGYPDLFCSVLDVMRTAGISLAFTIFEEAISSQNISFFENILSVYPANTLNTLACKHFALLLGQRGTHAMMERFLLELLDEDHPKAVPQMLYGAASMGRSDIVCSLSFYCDVPAVLEAISSKNSPSPENTQAFRELEMWVAHEQSQRIVAHLETPVRTTSRKI